MPTKTIDMIGRKFGFLTAIEAAPTKGNGAMWRCRCDCGNVIVSRGNVLRAGQVKSCGCWRKDGMNQTQPSAMANYIGRRFGKLLVADNARDKAGRRAWKCMCDCGGETVVRTGLLSNGNTKSCGCAQVRNSTPTNNIDADWPGVYLICFASGHVKFGRATSVKKRVANYRREAILAGGAEYHVVRTDDGAIIERKMLAYARGKAEQMIGETFSNISPQDALQIMLLSAGVEAANSNGPLLTCVS